MALANVRDRPLRGDGWHILYLFEHLIQQLLVAAPGGLCLGRAQRLTPFG